MEKRVVLMVGVQTILYINSEINLTINNNEYYKTMLYRNITNITFAIITLMITKL